MLTDALRYEEEKSAGLELSQFDSGQKSAGQQGPDAVYRIQQK